MGWQSSVVVLGSRFEILVAQMGALNISEPLSLGPTGNKVKSTFRRLPSKTQTYLLTYLFSNLVHPCFNDCITEGSFPSCLKYADVRPIFKKGSRNLKDNYRPVSVLPNISKVFERPIFKQLSDFNLFLNLSYQNFNVDLMLRKGS